MTSQGPSAPPSWASEMAVLRPAAPSDAEAVLAMVARCSRASLYHRFHGFTDGVAYFEHLLSDRSDDQTLLAWYGSACVGVATLGLGATGVFDLGILVEDAWQRRGIGSRLAASLLDRGRAKGVTVVHAEVLSEDPFIVHALRRIVPLTASICFGSFSIDIDVSRKPCRPSAIGPLNGANR